jgi:hypothetical protein
MQSQNESPFIPLLAVCAAWILNTRDVFAQRVSSIVPRRRAQETTATSRRWCQAPDAIVPGHNLQGRAHNTWRNSPYVAVRVTRFTVRRHVYISQNSTLRPVSAVGTSYE